MRPAFLSYPVQTWIADLHRQAQRDARFSHSRPAATPEGETRYATRSTYR